MKQHCLPGRYAWQLGLPAKALLWPPRWPAALWELSAGLLSVLPLYPSIGPLPGGQAAQTTAYGHFSSWAHSRDRGVL